LGRRYATPYCSSLGAGGTPILTPILAICTPVLTPNHSGCLSFGFFCYS
jgi:hypothetical protein